MRRPASSASPGQAEIATPSADIDKRDRDAGFAPYEPKDLPQGFDARQRAT
jgi:hypothetical protein